MHPHASFSRQIITSLHARLIRKPLSQEALAQVKLRLARLSFALFDLLIPESSQLMNPRSHQLAWQVHYASYSWGRWGPRHGQKLFPVLSLLLPSHVSLLLTYKREGTQGNRGDFSFDSLHSDGALSHCSSSSVSQTWLLHTCTQTPAARTTRTHHRDLGPSSLSRHFVSPHYKSVQTTWAEQTGRRVLLHGGPN
jgi:hypothetical protein